MSVCDLAILRESRIIQTRGAFPVVPALPLAADAQTLYYDPEPLQFGKLRLPNSPSQAPVVIVVHGGFFADHLPGNHPPPDYSLMKPLSVALTRGGVATWNIEYRRAGGHGGGWPNTFLDLAKAVDYLCKSPRRNGSLPSRRIHLEIRLRLI